MKNTILIKPPILNIHHVFNLHVELFKIVGTVLSLVLYVNVVGSLKTEREDVRHQRESDYRKWYQIQTNKKCKEVYLIMSYVRKHGLNKHSRITKSLNTKRTQSSHKEKRGLDTR